MQLQAYTVACAVILGCNHQAVAHLIQICQWLQDNHADLRDDTLLCPGPTAWSSPLGPTY
eukprot:13310783-Ditylum_brightwellii.AAC.1